MSFASQPAGFADREQLIVTSDKRSVLIEVADGITGFATDAVPFKMRTVLDEREPLPDALEQIERATIEKALIATRYNKTKAAAQLGITFRALRYKLKKLGME